MSFYTDEFTTRIAPMRVRFGAGSRYHLGRALDDLGVGRALVLSTPPQRAAAQTIAQALGERAVGLFDRAAMHTPTDISDAAVEEARAVGADCVVAIGGGSTIGLSKAIAWRTDLPQIVIPTTYAGSEATPILGQTEHGRKTTLSDPKVQPEVIVYDPELVATLPIGMTVTSALNAMAHAAEALYARDRNPLSSALAVEGLGAFVDALPRVIEAPDDISPRGETLYGAWLCGTVLAQVGMALHHKLCHTLGGSFGLPHAETHAVVLPHAIHFNAAAVPDLLAPLADLLGEKAPGIGLHELAGRLGAPLSLRQLGLDEADLDRAAGIAAETPYWNPRPVTRDAIRAILQDAWAGDSPGTTPA